jgi:hypothetical protein
VKQHGGNMVVVLEDRLRGISKIDGRCLEEIIADINQRGEATPRTQELIDTINYLVDRLTFSDSKRFLD